MVDTTGIDRNFVLLLMLLVDGEIGDKRCLRDKYQVYGDGSEIVNLSTRSKTTRANEIFTLKRTLQHSTK